MHSVTDTERRRIAEPGPRLTSVRRQPRPADPDLEHMDRRIGALADRGRVDPAQRCRVVLLGRKLGWLVRDREAGGAQWITDARNLLLAIEREEATNA